jgi:hypothetical protein
MASRGSIWRYLVWGMVFGAVDQTPLRAEDHAKATDTPPIFSHPITGNEDPEPMFIPDSRLKASGESSPWVLEALMLDAPAFDPKVAIKDTQKTGGSATQDAGSPVLMEPFTVNDSKILELKKAPTLLGEIARTGNIFVHVGRKLTIKMTFADLAQQTGWSSPTFSNAPPKLRIQFSIFW